MPSSAFVRPCSAPVLFGCPDPGDPNGCVSGVLFDPEVRPLELSLDDEFRPVELPPDDSFDSIDCAFER